MSGSGIHPESVPDSPTPTTVPPEARGLQPGSSTRRHVESLDGLRALSIAAVLLFHAGLPGTKTGWLGVDLFFVLSGFLITSLLSQEQDRTGKVSLPKFWGRRFLRLMPAYWLYAGLMTFLLFVAHFGWTGVVRGWTPSDYFASIWLYYANYAPPFDIWEHQHLTGHLWSLAVEEQFYLIWPIVFAITARRRLTEAVAWGLVLATFLISLQIGGPPLSFRLYTRGMGILMGCAFALASSRSLGFVRWLEAPKVRVAVLIAAAMSALVPTALVYAGRINDDQMHHYFSPIFYLTTALLATMLWHGPKDRITRVLSWVPLVFVGRISYGIYLYHMLAHYLAWSVLTNGLEHWNNRLRYGLRLTLFLTISMTFALLSYYLLERPFLKLKSRLR